MIQDNIALAQNHDAVDTVVEAIDPLLKVPVSLSQTFQIALNSYAGQTPQTFRCKRLH